jgi:ATP-dependent RNA helicase HelY
MAVNLIARYDEQRAHELLAASFANHALRRRASSLTSNLDDRRRDLATFRAALRDAPDSGEDWQGRARRAERDIRRLERRIARQARQTVVTDFDALHGVLDHFGYTKGWELLGPGRSLRRLYNELDLLLAQCLRAGTLDGLDAPTFAGVLSVFTFESRGGEVAPWPTTPAADQRIERILETWQDIVDVEERHGLQPTREPDLGLVDTLTGWAEGLDLEDIFHSDDVRAGDFVRAARQVLDLLRQVRDGYPDVAGVASEAIERIDRGIVDTGRNL